MLIVLVTVKSQASEKLEVRGLLGLACRALTGKIKGKSPRETCHILDIRGVFDDANQDLKLVEKALAALNIYSPLPRLHRIRTQAQCFQV